MTFLESRAGTARPNPPFKRLPTADRDLIESAGFALDLLQGKWKLHLIVVMARGIRRHSRLLDCVPGVSKKVMTDCLRSLERDGIVNRRVFAEVPARVEYTLTPLGWSLTHLVMALSDWGGSHAGDITSARRAWPANRAAVPDAYPQSPMPAAAFAASSR